MGSSTVHIATVEIEEEQLCTFLIPLQQMPIMCSPMASVKLYHCTTERMATL